MFRAYADFTKLGIVIFVLLSGLAGYATSFAVERPFDWKHLMTLMLGLFCLSSGSLALNQLQEIEADRKMPRTEKRPLVSGKISVGTGAALTAVLLVLGSALLWVASPMSFYLGLATLFLYNVVYVYWWKKYWVFGAVPGAIPGALPVTIGFAGNTNEIFREDSIYLFLVLFLWQMPHYWALALRYREDYRKAGVPVLPTVVGVERTLFHIGIYTFLYAAVAIGSPWFVGASWIYILIVVPTALKVLWEFYKFQRANAEAHWLKFFMWVNVSLLAFLFVPVIDRWSFIFIGRT